jgi:2-amino-4-hydroxy-6-hydroxymethyldihydropteridine diphosphokinase
MARLAAHHTAFVSVGSNLGDKLGNCLKGIAALADSGYTEVVGVSRFFRTSPVDYTQQDWFVNAAVKIKTVLDPKALLDELVSIQRRTGRKAGAIRFGPRVLDLDILLYDALVMHTPQLEIPHPRMHKRAFVLRPICDIEPAVVHPVLGKSAADLLENLDDEAQQVIALENQPILLKGRLP